MERDFSAVNEFLDLLGDPIPRNHGRRGRPAHVPTEQNISKVKVLWANGYSKTRIAAALRITKPTLQKHYSTVLEAARYSAVVATADRAAFALQQLRVRLVEGRATAADVNLVERIGGELAGKGGRKSRTPR